MTSVVSKTIKISSFDFPLSVDFIEKEIIKNNIEPLRWAIVDISENCLVLSVSGRILN